LLCIFPTILNKLLRFISQLLQRCWRNKRPWIRSLHSWNSWWVGEKGNNTSVDVETHWVV